MQKKCDEARLDQLIADMAGKVRAPMASCARSLMPCSGMPPGSRVSLVVLGRACLLLFQRTDNGTNGTSRGFEECSRRERVRVRVETLVSHGFSRRRCVGY